MYCAEMFLSKRSESFLLQVFYDSFDEDFKGRWVVSQSSDYGGTKYKKHLASNDDLNFRKIYQSCVPNLYQGLK